MVERARVETIAEILEWPNGGRRDRNYPREVKKTRGRYKQRKADYIGVRYCGPALVVIRAPRPYCWGYVTPPEL
jgi:hypothetical protein